MNIMNVLFDSFEKQGVRYVHFKGNTLHLERNFKGEGDFDVLIDPHQSSEAEFVLINMHAKRRNSVIDKRNPGIDNWLLFDEETGIIYHLHLHYRLALGMKPIPEYNLPFEDLLLEKRTYNEEYGLYVNSPENELILIYIRSTFGRGIKKTIKLLLGRSDNKSLLSQRQLLINKVDSDTLNEEAQFFFKDDSSTFIQIVNDERYMKASYSKMCKLVDRQLNKYKLRKSGAAYLGNLSVRVHRKLLSFLNYRFNAGYIFKKVPNNTGLIIAFVGVDGSGKSTTAKEIYKWLSSKMEAKRYYMGLGDGRTTLLGTILKRGHKLVDKQETSGSEGSIIKPAKKALSFKENPLFYIKKRAMVHLVYSVEKKNYRKLLDMWKYRARGGISILDRYPQIELPDVNDGPKIARYSRFINADSFIKRMSVLEMQKLDIVKDIKPDIVFRLSITAKESMRRKPEQKDIAVYQKKIDEIKQICFQGAKIIDINAEQPYEAELLEIKKMIWAYL